MLLVGWGAVKEEKKGLEIKILRLRKDFLAESTENSSIGAGNIFKITSMTVADNRGGGQRG